MTTTADLWYHYGRTRAATDRGVPEAFRWSWGQDSGPGPEILGALNGRIVGDLGAGSARHAAYLAAHRQPAGIDAIDASPAQCDMGTSLYGHLAPRLRVVRSDVIAHLRTAVGVCDALYSVFGAIDFTDPRKLLPAAAASLRPGGRLVFATLSTYLNGEPAQPDVDPADIPARTPGGEPATMPRWVLQEQVWTKLLDHAGFTRINVDVLPGSPETLLASAHRAPG